MKLNDELLLKQGVTGDEEMGLLNAYSELDDLLANPELYENPVQMIEELEFELQKLWHFPLDSNYHRYWKYIGDCACSKMDNEDPMYFGRRVINADCTWHNVKECAECHNKESVGHKMDCGSKCK